MKRPIVIKLFGGLVNPLTCLGPVSVLFLLCFLGSCSRTAKETVLIPDGFVGEFRIGYGEKCGLNPKMERGRRVLEIPQNGLLIIQPEFEEGIIDRQYYILDSDFNRAKINQLVNYEERKIRAPGVLAGSSGSLGGVMPPAGESPSAIHFTDFTMFNADTTTIDERARYKLHQRFDSITTELVKTCRKTTQTN